MSVDPNFQEENGLFKKGNPGGPGRPKDSFSLVGLLKDALKSVPEGEKKSYAELLIKKILDKGIIEGDAPTHRLIFNYMDGLPQQFLDVTSKGKPIPILGGASNDPDAIYSDDSDEEDNETKEED